MDYDRLEVLVALCPAADGTVVADVRIDGPPVP